MLIKKVIPSGYCKGVVRAIELAKKTRKENPNEKIYVLGMIVHNKFVTRSLEKYNIKTLVGKDKEQLLKEIDEGIVIFSAHGIAQKYKDIAISKGLKYVDASCDDVIKTQENIKNYLKQNYLILYVGKKDHPEADAVLSISKDIFLITNKNDIKNIEISKNKKIYVTNQTTMSIFEVAFIFENIKEKYPNAVFEEEICNATSNRQKAILNLKDVDLLYVVGDPSSNNTAKLKEIAEKNGIKNVIAIETCQDIKENHLEKVENIYVTAGASTPNYLTNQVIEVLKNYQKENKLTYPEIVFKDII